MGQPTKLTPEVRERIVQAVRAGAYYTHAAAYAGVHRATLYGWLDRGRTERERLDADADAKPKKSEAVYLDIFDTLTRVEAEAVIEAVAHWKTAARSDWRAAKEWLARRHSEEWGDRARLEHTGPDGGPITLSGLAEMMGVEDE